MTSTIDVTLSGLTAIVAGVFGSKALPFVAQATTPDWAQPLLGPFGALIGLAAGLVWMNKRLSKAEEKADKREEERDSDRKQLITVVTQNSAMLERVEVALQEKKQ